MVERGDVLDKLHKGRVFDVEISHYNGEPVAWFQELCDENFSLQLPADQVLGLSMELEDIYYKMKNFKKE